nr:unnamed protein product [Digitaria exilis]
MRTASTTAVLRSYRCPCRRAPRRSRRLLQLPQVFADDRHLGGAEEVCCLHEAGELRVALDGCDVDGVAGRCVRGDGEAQRRAWASGGGEIWTPSLTGGSH